MLVIFGGDLYFSPKVKPCLNLWSLFIENSWLTVVLGQNQGEIQPLKEEFETQKINFLEFLGILPMKSLIPGRIYTCWSTATFFFFSLSLRFLKEWWDFRSFRKGVYSPSRELILVLIMSEEYLLCKYKCTKTLSGMASLLFKWPCT